MSQVMLPKTGSVPNLRYERKFLIHPLSMAQALALIRQHPALFREVYPPRSVNSIYLDSPGLRNYHDHVSGSTNRTKTRIRWYGELDGCVDHPILERKIKRGSVSGKLGYPLPSLGLIRSVSAPSIVAALGAAEPLYAASHPLQPSLVNRYRRRYYASADGRVRLTVDWEFQFFGFRGFTCGEAPLSPSVPRAVIELKFDPRFAEQAEIVAGSFPFRIVRCSKYVLGIETMAFA
jgi:hypothetical protein